MNLRACFHHQRSPDGRCLTCGQKQLEAIKGSEEDTLSTLWAEANAAIAAQPSLVALELNASALKKYEDERDEFTVLWEVADRAIDNPQKAPQYATLSASGPTRLRSPSLASALQEAERQTQSSLSLKGTDRAVTAEAAAQYKKQEQRIQFAPRRLRLAAGIFDFGYLIVMAALITLSLFWFIAPELRPVLFSPGLMSRPIQITVASAAVVILIVISFLYPFLSGSRTTGQKLFGLETLAVTGNELPPRSRALRALLLPLSALLLPCLPSLWRPLGFHNQLSGAVVAKTH